MDEPVSISFLINCGEYLHCLLTSVADNKCIARRSRIYMEAQKQGIG